MGGVVLSLAVVAAVYLFVLPRIAHYGAVWRRVEDLPAAWIAVLALATTANLATFTFPWLVLVPRLGFTAALRVTQASTALIMVVPGGAPMGMAATFAMLRSWKVPGRLAALAVALSGIWNQLSIFLLPLVAVIGLALSGRLDQLLEAVALTGAALAVALAAALALALSSEERTGRLGDLLARGAERIGRPLGRRPVSWGGATLQRFRAETLALLHRRWIVLTLATLANQLAGFLVLVLSVRALGISPHELPLSEVFAAWTVGRLIGSLPLTPGGFGFVELGLVGALVGFGGSHASVVAAVLVYRFLVVAPTLVLGALSGATWRLRR